MDLLTMLSVICIIICCHCCGVREELHLVYLVHPPKTWREVSAGSAERSTGIPEGGQGGSPFVSIKEVSQKLSISVTR
eukprot:scaffold8908_cov106-Skeletonema_dohrnii-CCMP3373.AAC.2